MYDHLRTWTTELDRDTSARLDLWDTGRTRDGKTELRYALAIIPLSDVCAPVVIFDGEQFWPSPLHAIDSDESAAALLGFFAADGESMPPQGLAIAPVILLPPSEYCAPGQRGDGKRGRGL